jgi:hypothetical protein
MTRLSGLDAQSGAPSDLRSAAPEDATAELTPARLDDMWREAQLTDLGFDAVGSTLCLVFDLRGALDFPDCDIALIRLRPVYTFASSGPGAAHRYSPQYVVGCTMQQGASTPEITFSFVSGQSFSARAREVEAVVGRSDLFDLAPPDLTRASPEQVAAGFPRLDRRFEAYTYFKFA